MKPRYQRFADRLLSGDNYVDAYLAAGFKCKRENVGKSAWRLKQNPQIAAYLEAAQKRAADEACLTLREIRHFLARIVRTPITKLDPTDKANADLIKTYSLTERGTSSSRRLEKLDPLKAIEMDLKLSGNDPGTNTIKQLAEALAALGSHDPIPTETL